jgi:hypothetical protein
MNASDVLIDELISCEKKILDCPKEIKEDRGYLKKSFTMESTDGKYHFSGFIRQNKRFLENFSIGLTYLPKEERGAVILMRCNGLHGRTKMNPHHTSCHIHKITASDWNEGIKMERNILPTTAYVTFYEAIQFFVREVNIVTTDAEKYFPDPSINFGLFEGLK